MTLVTFGLAGCLGGDEDDESEATDGDSEQDEDTDGDDENTEGDETAETDLEIAEFELLDQDDGNAVVASIHGDHWHDGPLEVPHGDNHALGASAEDEGANAIEFGDEYTLGVEVAADAQTGVVSSDPDEDFHGDHIVLYGEGDGSTAVVFQIRNDGHIVYETPDLEVTVGDSGSETDHDEGGHNEAGHDHDESDSGHDHDH